MNTEKLKPFNEFNSEKSAMVNEICYRLFNEQNNNFFKELRKIQLPEIATNTQIAVIIGTVAEYGNTGFLPVLVGRDQQYGQALAFGKYTDNSGNVKLVIRNTSTTATSASTVLYLLIMEVK